MLYIGAAIKNSAFHAEMEKAKAAGNPVWEIPTVDPGHLVGLLWTMHGTKGQREVISVVSRAVDPCHEGLVAVFPQIRQFLSRLLDGGPAARLLAAARDADMIVVGSRGAGGFARLLMGSVSTQVSHHARCPVVIVPAEDRG